MNTLVFTTHDITPQHWADFAKTAGCPPSGPNNEIHVPYILVHSPLQQDLDRTEQISTTVRTQLSSASWEQTKSSFLALAEPNSQRMLTILFLILDQQSTKDRKVIIVFKDKKWVTAEGNEVHPLPQTENQLTEWTVWTKYRVPFEEAFVAQCGLEGFCSPEVAEMYLEEIIEREVAPKA